MSRPAYDLLGIGNAIVDVVAPVDDAFLSRQDVRRGTMRLVSGTDAEALYMAMPPGQESSGGSAANTCAVAAGLGAKVAFLGKVADDDLGEVFRHDMKAAGVYFPTKPLVGASTTARSLVLVSPDGQRTMSTHLGACAGFSRADLDEELIADSAITYLEGYLFDPPRAQAAFLRAAEVAHAAGRMVAVSLSDPFCVDRHREAFRSLVEEHADILVANEAEVCSLYEEENFEAAAIRAARDAEIAVLTRSEAGSVILRGEERVDIPAEPARVLDTTGAGDAYAAGFLTGFAQGRNLASCGRLGSLAAAAAIQHYGARPPGNLRLLAERVGP